MSVNRRRDRKPVENTGLFPFDAARRRADPDGAAAGAGECFHKGKVYWSAVHRDGNATVSSVVSDGSEEARLPFAFRTIAAGERQ
jgi:hypothetical protein